MHEIQEKLLKLAEDNALNGLTLREMGALIKEKQPQKIKHHLLQLEKKGLIIFDKRKRIVSRVGGNKLASSLIPVPILGSANCGPSTIFANENIEGYLRVSKKLLNKKKDIFALRASGNSLNKADINGNNIEDGDYVIVDSQKENVRPGNYVVSVIDGLANIKRYVFDKLNSQIALISDSTHKYPPIYIHEDDDFIICGKVLQVIKKPSVQD